VIEAIGSRDTVIRGGASGSTHGSSRINDLRTLLEDPSMIDCGGERRSPIEEPVTDCTVSIRNRLIRTVIPDPMETY
jgi:hypothetical protein